MTDLKKLAEEITEDHGWWEHTADLPIEGNLEPLIIKALQKVRDETIEKAIKEIKKAEFERCTLLIKHAIPILESLKSKESEEK